MRTILRHLKDHQVIVVSAAPSSGKSSVLPQCLVSGGYGPVICAQPRHFAATVASAKAGDGCDSGVTFTTTRVLADAFRNPQPVAAAYRAVVIDEAHDRTLSTDLLLGMVSAALASGSMGDCRVVCTAGGPADGVLRARRLVPREGRRVPAGGEPGGAGALLAGARDRHGGRGGRRGGGHPPVEAARRRAGVLAGRRPRRGGLPPAAAARPSGAADLRRPRPPPGGAHGDVAETAVPVPGIAYVVDSSVLSEEPLDMISKEAAQRRLAVAGGGSGPGHCHRLYMQEEHAGFGEHAVPSIWRNDAHIMFALILKRHGADVMPGFEFLDPSMAPALESVIGQLVAAGFLDKHGKLTEKGGREAYDED
ncbi:hypothetical protein ACP70R_016458 [Stipagrostis hirtigluma subsp. patula]